MQNITIEVEIPEGYEFVRFGTPKKDELFLSAGPIVRTCDNPNWTYCPLVIIKKSWVRPGWMKPGWIAKNSYQEWYWFTFKPNKGNYDWTKLNITNSVEIPLKFLNWVEPECFNWEESLKYI